MKRLIRTGARRITAAELAIVAIVTPALLFPTPGRASVLLVLVAVWACARFSTGHAVPPTPLNTAIGVLLVMVAVSALVTFDVRFSLGKIAGVLLGIAWFWAAVRWTTTPQRLRWATSAFMAAGAGLTAVGLLGTDWGDKLPVLGTIAGWLPRSIRGVPGAESGFNPNAVAGALVLFVPLQACLAWWAYGSWRENRSHGRPGGGMLAAACTALLAASVGTLALTQSRGAWTGLALAGLLWWLWRGGWRRWGAAAILAGGVVALTLTGPDEAGRLLFGSAGSSVVPDAGARLEVWSRAIDAIQDFPATGMGMNVFRRLMPVLYPVSWAPPGVDVPHAHNHLLQAALDLGIPGLVAYCAIWLLAGAMLVGVLRHSEDRLLRSIAAGLALGLAAHFVFGIADVIPLGAKVGAVFWFALALTAAVHRAAVSGS